MEKLNNLKSRAISRGQLLKVKGGLDCGICLDAVTDEPKPPLIRVGSVKF